MPHHLETMTVTTDHLNRVTEFAKAQRLSTQEAISTMIDELKVEQKEEVQN